MLKKYHVGEFINEYMEVLGISETELSKGTGISRSHINNIRLCKKDLNVDIANKISEILNVSSTVLLNLQNDFTIYKKQQDWISLNERVYNKISPRMKELFLMNESVSTSEFDLFLNSRKTFAGIRGFNYYEPSKSSDVKNYIIMKSVEGVDNSTNYLDIGGLSNYLNNEYINEISNISNIAQANTFLFDSSKKLYNLGINLEITKSGLGTTIKGITKLSPTNAKVFIENTESFVKVIWHLTHELMHIIHQDEKEERNINDFAKTLLINKFSKTINFIKNEEFIFENKDKLKGVNPYILASIWRYEKKMHAKKNTFEIEGAINDIFYTQLP